MPVRAYPSPSHDIQVQPFEKKSNIKPKASSSRQSRSSAVTIPPPSRDAESELEPAVPAPNPLRSPSPGAKSIVSGISDTTQSATDAAQVANVQDTCEYRVLKSQKEDLESQVLAQSKEIAALKGSLEQARITNSAKEQSIRDEMQARYDSLKSSNDTLRIEKSSTDAQMACLKDEVSFWRNK